MMKSLIAAALVVSFSGMARAESTPANMLIYIDPQDYTSEVKLWQYYTDYWFAQGPYVEKAAKQVLGHAFADVGMCDNNQAAGNTLVWLRPRIFYNPQMMTYHGKVTAVVYTATGQPLASYEGTSSKLGFINVKPELNLNIVYTKALEMIVQKMKADTKLQENLDKVYAADDAKTPCGMVSLLPTPKIQFMSF